MLDDFIGFKKEEKPKHNINFKPLPKQHEAWTYLTDNKTRNVLYGGLT